MEITESQFEKIKHVLPRPRGNVKHDPLTQLNGMLYVLENGCKWRALPERYGPWNTVYRRWERWSKKGVMAGDFQGVARARGGRRPRGDGVAGQHGGEGASGWDRGAKKKRCAKHRQVARGMDDEDPRDRGGRLHGGELLAVGRAGRETGRRAGSCWRRLR